MVKLVAYLSTTNGEIFLFLHTMVFTSFLSPDQKYGGKVSYYSFHDVTKAFWLTTTSINTSSSIVLIGLIGMK